MNRRRKSNSITIIEIIAVLLIIAVIVILLNPTVEKIRDEMNKRQYITDVNTYVDRAIAMYGNDQYKDKFEKKGDTYTILFENIDSVGIVVDPYGFNYQLKESSVTFNAKTKDVVVNAKSCTVHEGVDYCYEIVDINTKELNTNSIKASVN